MNGSYPQPPPSPYQPPQTPPSGGGSGCFIKGCLVVVVVLMILGVAFGGLGWYLWHSAQPFLTREPVAIRTVDNPDAKYADVQKKLANFNATLATGQPAVLTLTADDLNGLVARDPQFSDLRDRLFLSIVNNQIVAETSFPLNNDKTLRGSQRWFFNARCVLDASYAAGDFAFQLARFEALDGKQPPAALMGFVRFYATALTQKFNRNFHEHPEDYGDLRQITDQLRMVIIKDNQIVATSVEHPKPIATPTPSPVADTPEPK